MKRLLKVLMGISILASAFSCSTSNQISVKNLAYQYRHSINEPSAAYAVFHRNDSVSVLYIGVNSSSLLYVRAAGQKHFSAHYKVGYEVYHTYESKTIADSAHIQNTDTTFYGINGVMTDSIVIHTKGPGLRILKVVLTDLNRNSVKHDFIELNKKDAYQAQNFLLRDGRGAPVLKSQLASNAFYRIQVNRDIPSVQVRYFADVFPLAAPPFSEGTPEQIVAIEDSTFDLALSSGISEVFMMKKKGIYQFRSSTDQQDGFSVCRFYDGYPGIHTQEQLLAPLRYLTSKQEFDAMCLMKDKKRVVDEFWIEITGNADRARKRIKTFYNRVQDANKFFTSYKEGWKTDRGMIYVMYGVPNNVTRENDREIWTYDESNIMLTVNFVFLRSDNPFCDNDFILERLSNLKNSWYYAIDKWRR